MTSCFAGPATEGGSISAVAIDPLSTSVFAELPRRREVRASADLLTSVPVYLSKAVGRQLTRLWQISAGELNPGRTAAGADRSAPSLGAQAADEAIVEELRLLHGLQDRE